jgi:CO/xanthine dehydrogenase FAD-binding subunit
MIKQFKFEQPKDLQGALRLLDKYRGYNARLIAGGTDIVPGFQQESSRFKDIEILIAIHDIKELKLIERKGKHVFIGAGVTFSELTGHPLIKELYPLLVKAAGSIGSVQIRNRATIAGNFVNNAPCADSVAPLLVYEAMIQIQSPYKKRAVSLEDFLLNPYKTQLQPDEIVTRVDLPIIKKGIQGDFFKLGRRRGVAISRISLALLLDIENTFIHELRVASGAVTPIGIRFKQLEQSARGKKATPDLFAQLAQELGQQILDITGLRWSTAYKLPVAQQLFYRLLEDICTPTS